MLAPLCLFLFFFLFFFFFFLFFFFFNLPLWTVGLSRHFDPEMQIRHESNLLRRSRTACSTVNSSICFHVRVMFVSFAAISMKCPRPSFRFIYCPFMCFLHCPLLLPFLQRKNVLTLDSLLSDTETDHIIKHYTTITLPIDRTPRQIQASTYK